MDPLLILVIGMAVVISGVLWFKLPAFVALIGGAFVVAALTPSDALFRRELQRNRLSVVADATDNSIKFSSAAAPEPGRYVVWHRDASSQQLTRRGQLDLHQTGDDWHYSNAEFMDSTSAAPRQGDWLVEQRDVDAARTLRDKNWAERIAAGFGTTCGNIGILIAMAAIIGRCLLDSGAAERIVSAMRAAFGERRTPLALVLSGFVIGIPVYFDTVFYLLLPLARALGRRNATNYLLYVMSIIVGASMAHSLVPPTPGPLLVAAELNVELTEMILAGTVVGLIAAASGFSYAVWANRRWTIDVPELAQDATDFDPASTAPRPSPPWLAAALLPIFLPVVLLSMGTLLKSQPDLIASASVRDALLLISDKHVALGLATIFAIIMLAQRAPRAVWIQSLQDGVVSAGNIVLITAAGGAFGLVLRQSGIAEAVQQRFPLTQAGLGLLVVAFLITALVRVAQGSATVAMITAVGIIAPIVQATTLPFHPVYVALAIGCGSKPMPWMNDSGFWVITRMSGMTEAESLRTVSVALTIMGGVGLAATLAGATWFPN